MTKIVLTNAVVSGFAVAILGLAGPAQAAIGDDGPALHAMPGVNMGVDHVNWLDDIRQKVNVPKVDGTVRQSR